MAKTRKCKTCGRLFKPEHKGEEFCSALCRTAGCFVGGGGDTSKPNAVRRKAYAAKPQMGKLNHEKFAKVDLMFSLPIGERAALAKTFTEEERQYALRMARRQLREEQKFDEMVAEDEMYSLPQREADIAGGSLGESDDGTI